MEIRCRAKISPECYDGKDEFDGIYDPDGPGMSEDGTWNGKTVVCDACYIAIGTPTNDQLDAVIARYKEIHESAGELEQTDADAEASPDDYGGDE